MITLAPTRPARCSPPLALRVSRLPASRRAFSLIEILVSVALLAVIMIGLVAMFGQTQKAFRAGLTQTDVLESGRSLTDMLGREIQEMRPSQADGVTNFFVDVNSPQAPLQQTLPGNPVTPQSRINVLEDLFFLSLNNRQWQGIGYHVDAPDGLFGKLYRWTTNPAPNDVGSASQNFSQGRASLNNFTRVADGVVHFRIRAYDTNGVWLTTNALAWRALGPDRGTNIALVARPQVSETAYVFRAGAIPAYVDIELGVLDPRTLERAKSIADPLAQRNYLGQQAGAVQIFRQRIPLPNVDPTAYP